MLRFAQNAEHTRKWIIDTKDLRVKGLRSPQGFTFELPDDGTGNYFWTTNEFAAFLFYKRHRLATNEVKDYFAEKFDKANYLYELSYATDSPRVYEAPTGYAFRPYQNAGIEYCQLSVNCLVADEMRLGKTSQSIGVITNTPDINKVLIICPKTAKLVWLKELCTWLLQKKKIQILTAQSKIDPNADIYIVNYDILHILSGLSDILFDLIIADEVHACKSKDARRSRFFFALKGKRKLGLSGTPLLNKPKDLLTVLQWLDPFWKEFHVYKGSFITRTGILLTLEEVQDIIRSSLMLRRVQAQVFGSEPLERRVVPLQTPPELQYLVSIEHDSYRKAWRLNDYTTARRLLGINRVQLAINHMLTYSTEGEKIICFAWHKEVINRIASSLGARAVVIYGDTTDEQRKRNVERFNNDSTCQIIVGSIPAMSMAIDLSVSNHIVFVETDWTPGLIDQAEERGSAKDKTQTVLVEYLVYQGSLDEHMANIRIGKEETTSSALDVVY